MDIRDLLLLSTQEVKTLLLLDNPNIPKAFSLGVDMTNRLAIVS